MLDRTCKNCEARRIKSWNPRSHPRLYCRNCQEYESITIEQYNELPDPRCTLDRSDNYKCQKCSNTLCVRPNTSGGNRDKSYFCSRCQKVISTSSLLGISESEHRSRQVNKKAEPRGRSGYKGVSWNARRGFWIAEVVRLGKRYYLGAFVRAEDAAIAYNTKALELYGSDAYQNIIVIDRNSKDYEYGTKGPAIQKWQE